MSSEVEILCNQADCDLEKPIRISVVKDQMFIVQERVVQVFEGM